MDQNDPIFIEEQQHLTTTYDKLREIERQLNQKLGRTREQATEDISNMYEELSFDYTTDDHIMETYAEYESMNRIIDGYNISMDVARERLDRTHLLMEKPYFAKLRLQFRPGAEPKDVYIGAAGMTDENRRHFIIDWRSPVAEVYYNQANGRTSYQANGRTINVDLQLRRQFDIRRDKLISCFDTTVAIEDPLLLASLQRSRTDKLQDITTTIQREQNMVIRHADVPVLLVSGIAGSGKTSVLLQRIAYLFYNMRDTLDPENVFLLTPNPVFQHYIEDVLPGMGERNPQTLTFEQLVRQLGLPGWGETDATTPEMLDAIDQALDGFELQDDDITGVKVGDDVILPASQIRKVVHGLRRIPAGPRLFALVCEDLHDRLTNKLASLTSDEDIQERMLELPVNEQMRIFGQQIFPQTEEDYVEYARMYLNDHFAPAYGMVENACWLNINRIGARMLGKPNLAPMEWLYLKLALTGINRREAAFVMIDEVQDYTQAQLMVLGRYFKNAHFLLLGDENQAIKAQSSTFDQVRWVFERRGEAVSECSLMTSYRSSPEITALFSRLLPEEARIQVSSVRRPGVEPVVRECLGADEYAAALREAVDAAWAEACGGEGEGAHEHDCCHDDDCCCGHDHEHAAEPQGLVAVIAAGRKQAKRIAGMLGEGALLVGEGQKLPQSGVVVMALSMAKGLEFDHVIIPDAQAEIYRGDDLSRRRLYTAISRATQRVTILSNGPMTGLLK